MKKTCLVTGPEIETWPDDCNLKLLGDFCINDSNSSAIQDREFTVVHPYGDNADTRKNDKDYVEHLYEKILVSLSNFLNINHNVNYPVRYWRILIGPWLNAIIPVLYNRWKKIDTALSSSCDEIIGVRYSLNSITPYDVSDFAYIHLRPEWNSDLISRILEFRKINFQIFDYTSIKIKHIQPNKLSFIWRVRRYLGDIIRYITFKDNNYFFLAPYIPRKELIKLQLLLGQFPVFYRSKESPHINPDISYRETIVFDFFQSNNFERFIADYLRYAIPTIYLEGFSNLSKITNSMLWPKEPRLIFTANSFYFDEIFKKWTADKILINTPYFIGQHGGGYGIKEFAQRTELHEQKTSDFWLSWGGVKYLQTTVINSTNLKLIGKKITGNNYNKPFLLQITDDLFPYSRFPWCSDSFNKIYMDEQVRFALSLDNDIQKNLVVRLHYNQSRLGVDQKKYWKEKAPYICIDDGFSSINKLIAKSRVVVSTYNATSFLETLALDIPTIMFWSMDKSPVDDEAKPYFDILLKCGIFHNTPESAANHISLIWNNVSDWWEHEDVQKAKISFCNHFSRNIENPIGFIHDLISKKLD
jgi:putative transferase (TIGR04331 family)